MKSESKKTEKTVEDRHQEDSENTVSKVEVEHKEVPKKKSKSGSDKCRLELEEIKNAYSRVCADFENYRRRMNQERTSLAHHLQADLISGLLGVADDFDRALEESKKGEGSENFDAWIDGFVMINKSLHKFLEKNGVAEIDQMKTFDPNLHEALIQVDSDDHKSGEIVSAIQKGFTLKYSTMRFVTIKA